MKILFCVFFSTSKEFMAPSLELETSNGAILDDNDPLKLLFPMGTVQAEKVVGRVIEWKLFSVSDRYREICGNMGVGKILSI